MEEKEGVGASRRDVQASIAARTSELAEIEAVIEEHTSVVAALARRSEISDAELRRRADELQELRELSEASRKAAFWLQSPIHPRNVWAWMVARGPRMLFVIVATVVVLAAVRLSIFRLVRTVVGHKGGHGGGVARADTLALSFSGFSSLLIVVGGFFVLAQEAGVDLKTVLGGAAVLGVAIAFSAQNLMRDYFSGFMIHLDDPELMGVQALTESGATLRLSLKTKAGEMFSVRREMFRRIKNAFDEVGIEMGVPHRTVGESGAGSGGN
jgi:small conductance mechanosensitive channel